MESTTDPTTETTVESNDSPLSNLDLWCDWSGSPEDPVSVTIAMELRARYPNLNLPILNVQSQYTVKPPSWVLRLKPDFADYDTPSEKEASRTGHRDSNETERYPVNNGSISDSGSVVVHDGSWDDDPISRQTVDISEMCTQVESSDNPASTNLHESQSQVNSLGSPNSNPRKRSAKAASLPDSIPSEDDYQSTRHKLMMTKIDPFGPEPASQDTATTDIISSSPIGRLSVSQDQSSVINENIPPQDIPLPQESAPTLLSDSLAASEHLSLNGKGATVDNGNIPDETPLRGNANTPSKFDLSGTEPLTEANLLHRDYDTLSTRVCIGSLSATEDSDKEKEDLLISLDSLASSSHSGRDELPLPRTSAELASVPRLVFDNDIIYVQTPPVVYHATYQIAISLKVRLQKGKSRGWWELVVSGLPRLAQSESCYLYFRTPPGQGMEFMTSSFKRHTLVESCLMAQFDGGKCLVVPFRKCNAEFYGPLKDHKVNAVIRAEVEEAGSSYTYLIKYTAVCSIDLINHNFWAEKCKFRLFVHGGPEGEFEANFEGQKPMVNAICLPPVPDVDEIGVSCINITSIPQALDMFTVSWEVKLPRGKALTWLPWIKTRISYTDVESILQEDYALLGPKHGYLSPKREKLDTRCQNPCCELGVELNHFKPPVEKTPYSHDLFGICESGTFTPFPIDPTSKSTAETTVMETPPSFLEREVLPRSKLSGPRFGKRLAFKSASTQTFVGEIPAPKSTNTETRAAEPESKKPRRAVRRLWILLKFVFHLFAFLASIHTLYWSYLLHNCGFRYDPLALHASCPQNEVYVFVDHAKNSTNTDVGEEAETVLTEFGLQSELIRSEAQQSVNTTPADVTPMPLRDRIDYLLGWRGPIPR